MGVGDGQAEGVAHFAVADLQAQAGGDQVGIGELPFVLRP